MQQRISLRYTGAGYGGFLPNVPARDLTAAEVEEFGGRQALLASGLYLLANENKAVSGPTESKANQEASE